MCFAPHQKSYAGNSNYTGKYDFRTLLLFLRFNLVKINLFYSLLQLRNYHLRSFGKGQGSPQIQIFCWFGVKTLLNVFEFFCFIL